MHTFPVRFCPILILGILIGAATPASAAPSSLQAAAALDFRQVVLDAKSKVFPAVVYIKCLRESFEAGKKQTQEVAGSGVVISDDGLVLTNWHVMDKAVEIRCLLSDGRAMGAKVIGSDKDVDIALIRLEKPQDAAKLPFAQLGDSSLLREGDFVMAMGAPWNLNRSVSIGIISCVNRYLPDRSEYSLWLQTDASISPGNSGGPLVNTQGQVIGINTMGIMAGGDMGFAVPSATIKELLPRLQSGEVNWAWTGLRLQPLRDFHRNTYFDSAEGVIVADTDPESPARRAGVEPRDRIIRIDGRPVTALTEEYLPDLRRKLGLLEQGKSVKVELVRGKQTMTVEMTPRKKGKIEGEELDCPRWDLTVKAINKFDTPDLHFHRPEGVFVFGLKWPGNAQNAGLAPRDILVKIDDREIKTLQDVRDANKLALDNITSKHKVRLTVLRNGTMRQVILDYSRDFAKE